MTANWFNDALCAQVDTDMFFPGKGGSNRPAKRICSMCPVRAECLDYAMSHETGGASEERFGVYGGLSALEREALARRTEEVECRSCGQPFTPTRKQERYCSEQCRADALQVRREAYNQKRRAS